MSLPTPSPESLINFLWTIYHYLREFIRFILSSTVFKAAPEAAATYSDICTLLVALTALYLILEFVAAARKIVRVILIISWLLFIVSLLIGVMPRYMPLGG
ncbi:MAG: hypothetical protein QW374_01040 [Candidatus Bathyarchaeia archaeon]|nr:hypothetical protein [Candidatus Bathyarchaeota archaeon]